MGTPRLLITDHEKAMQTESIKNFLDQNNVSLHLGTPDNKTSNSDVERLHNTLNEHIRTINVKPRDEKMFNDAILEAIFIYNRTIHSTTGFSPSSLHRESNPEVIQNVYRKMIQIKERRINKINHNQRRVDKTADFNL